RQAAKLHLALESMPICVFELAFTTKETERIEKKQPKWGEYVAYLPRLKRRQRGDHFLRVSKGRGEKPTFTASRYIEHDGIGGVGNIAHVKDGEWLPLSRLAKNLKMNEKALLRMKNLDVYGIAIMRRDFPGTFA